MLLVILAAGVHGFWQMSLKVTVNLLLAGKRPTIIYRVLKL